ncbi:hypothetical protein Aab01nite_54510 [Paractinoplanes abujensis]|uniref:Uncharacterized protein n=1 Tax=Paractinoplanes abujensis TaxID=882441 RepID=A0A7W7CRN7_9ACTN|nr:hypothetical protein [Actinoplanes abujensis]MBB4693481.1 hypothetical protein [Actinoplanes abujensis]GID21861.1 hypothetical protein Aab01nite_54510 [Actinoplanes abujensis]
MTALAQLASPAVAGFDQGSAEDPVVVPPGPFFAVWGVVVLGCLVVAVRGLPEQRAGSDDYRRLHVPLSLAQAGFVAWLLAAATAPVITVPVFVLMLVAIGVALFRARSVRSGTRGPVPGAGALVESVLGVYAGWTAAAVWINTATLLDRPSASVLTGLLLGAVATAVLVVSVVARTAVARLAAGVSSAWALCGVAISTSTAGAEGLLAVAVAGLVAVIGASLVAAGQARRAARRNGHQPTAESV